MEIGEMSSQGGGGLWAGRQYGATGGGGCLFRESNNYLLSFGRQSRKSGCLWKPNASAITVIIIILKTPHEAITGHCAIVGHLNQLEWLLRCAQRPVPFKISKNDLVMPINAQALYFSIKQRGVRGVCSASFPFLAWSVFSWCLQKDWSVRMTWGDCVCSLYS